LTVSRSGSPGPAPTSVTLPSARPDIERAGKSGGIGDIFQRRFGFVLAPGENQRADRAIDTRSQKRRRSENSECALWIDLRQRPMKAGEIADPRRQHRLDALAHAARHDRRSSAGADGNDDVAAIDDGGKDKVEWRGRPSH
jgi:hypothetical protein